MAIHCRVVVGWWLRYAQTVPSALPQPAREVSSSNPCVGWAGGRSSSSAMRTVQYGGIDFTTLTGCSPCALSPPPPRARALPSHPTHPLLTHNHYIITQDGTPRSTIDLSRRGPASTSASPFVACSMSADAKRVAVATATGGVELYRRSDTGQERAAKVAHKVAHDAARELQRIAQIEEEELRVMRAEEALQRHEQRQVVAATVIQGRAREHLSRRQQQRRAEWEARDGAAIRIQTLCRGRVGRLRFVAARQAAEVAAKERRAAKVAAKAEAKAAKEKKRRARLGQGGKGAKEVKDKDKGQGPGLGKAGPDRSTLSTPEKEMNRIDDTVKALEEKLSAMKEPNPGAGGGEGGKPSEFAAMKESMMETLDEYREMKKMYEETYGEKWSSTMTPSPRKPEPSVTDGTGGANGAAGADGVAEMGATDDTAKVLFSADDGGDGDGGGGGEGAGANSPAKEDAPTALNVEGGVAGAGGEGVEGTGHDDANVSTSPGVEVPGAPAQPTNVDESGAVAAGNAGQGGITAVDIAEGASGAAGADIAVGGGGDGNAGANGGAICGENGGEEENVVGAIASREVPVVDAGVDAATEADVGNSEDAAAAAAAADDDDATLDVAPSVLPGALPGMSGVDGAAPEQGEKGRGKKSRKNKTSKSRRRGRSNTGDNAAERPSRGNRNNHGDGAGGYKATHGLGVDDRDSGHAGAVTSCAFSPDGTKLVSTGADGLVKVWNARQAKLQATLRGHRAEVLCCAWARSSINNNTGGNSDGGEAEEAASASSGGDVASGGADHRVRLWRPDTDFVPKVDEPGGRGWRPEWTFDGHTGPVTGVAFTKRARRMASVSWDGSMRLWCIETMTSLASIQVVSMGDVGTYVRLRSVACCPTDDDRTPDDGDEEDESGRGGRVITCCDDGTCQVWRPLLGTQIAVLRPPLSLMGMAGGDAEGFDDSGMGGVMGDTMLTTASTASSMACLSCDWSSDGARIMCGFGDGRVALWDAARVAPEIRTVCIRKDMDERSDAYGDQGRNARGEGRGHGRRRAPWKLRAWRLRLAQRRWRWRVRTARCECSRLRRTVQRRAGQCRLPLRR